MEDYSDGVIYLDPSGDLRLLIDAHGNQKQAGREGGIEQGTRTLVVSSKVLCLASPVWRAMFNSSGHFAEACSSAGVREVRLADDDPDALLLVLRIAHLQFRDISTELAFKQLLNIALVCDKYDISELVRPWLPQWLGWLKPMMSQPGYEEWLFIAWTFGDARDYEKLASQLVSQMTTDEKGQCYRSGKLLGRNLPPGALGKYSQMVDGTNGLFVYSDSILAARRLTIDALLRACHNVVELYLGDGLICEAKQSVYPFPLCDDDVRRQCDTLVLGSLIKSLKNFNVWNGPLSPDDIHMSVADFCEKLRSLSCLVLGRKESNHANCRFTKRIEDEVKRIEWHVIPSGMDPAHFKHMENQANK